jgi:hypothetical protein
VVSEVGQRIALVTVDPVPRVLYALIDAHSPQSSLPVGVTVIDSQGISSNDGAIALVYLNRLEDANERLDSMAGMLKDKVVLVAYGSAEKIGSCGEERLLTVADSELLRFVHLGTPEAEAAIKEAAAMARKRRGYEDDDEDEQE